MAFRTLEELLARGLAGKRVLVREDLNVPLAGQTITDDTRIRAALPTLRELAAHGAKVVVVSHLGRPKGSDSALSLAPVAYRLGELLERTVPLASGTVGAAVGRAVAAMDSGNLMVLENVRFHPEEEQNDPYFSRQLADLADVFVNDAFGAAHRAHASTEGVARLIPAYAGYLMARELEILGRLISAPVRPFWAIIGGAKVSTKIGVLKSLLSKVDGLVVGGAMANTFLKARGHAVGRSLVEDSWLGTANEIHDDAAKLGVRLLLPADVVLGAGPDGPEAGTVFADQIPDDLAALDIGAGSVRTIKGALESAKTVFWNGPMGVYESPAFAKGTTALAVLIAEGTARGVTTVVGGGDAVAALYVAGLADCVTHVSTGGGASLEFLEGKTLPGVSALETATWASQTQR